MRRPVTRKYEYLATALSELGCTVDELSAHLSIDCGDSATSIAEASFTQGAVETGSRHRGYR